MNKIQKMLHDLCPNGVEWKTLGEVCTTIIAPKKLDKKYYLPKGLYPIIDQGQKYIIAYTNDEEALLPSAEYVLFGDHTREIKYVDFAFAQGADGVKILQADTDILPKYLYYAMSNLQIPSRGYNRHWSIAKDLSIPIPPLPVQAEIVNLLDKFTQLSAELKKELQLRRKQYDYYRNHLLSFDSNSTTVQWMPLGEVAEFTYGYTDKAKDEGDVRYIRITDIDKFGRLSPFDAKYISYTDNIKNYILQKDDIVMARTGATFGKTMIFLEDYPAVYASFLIKIHLNKSILLPKYYWHFAQSPLYWEQANKLVAGGAQPQFNTGAISQVRLPIPPITEQERIVGILDKFETLVNDLSKGLPAEIALVQKQYEYYRNLLLTFE